MAKNAKTALRLLTDSDFQIELEMEGLRASRGGCPLSLVLFEPVLRDTRGREVPAQELLRCIELHASPCDSLGLLPGMRYALILPGAGVFRAQTIVENILQSFAHTGLSCMAGIAGAKDPENIHAEILLQQAATALGQNPDQSVAIRVYREQTEGLALRKTLVHSHEKRFLFSGGE